MQFVILLYYLTIRYFLTKIAKKKNRVIRFNKCILLWNYLLIFNNSSAEISSTSHNLAKVDKLGLIFPDKYCDKVGLDTSISSAICDFDFDDFTIASCMLREICFSNAPFSMLASVLIVFFASFTKLYAPIRGKLYNYAVSLNLCQLIRGLIIIFFYIFS